MKEGVNDLGLMFVLFYLYYFKASELMDQVNKLKDEVDKLKSRQEAVEEFSEGTRDVVCGIQGLLKDAVEGSTRNYEILVSKKDKEHPAVQAVMAALGAKI
jgi:hypothetical protein